MTLAVVAPADALAALSFVRRRALLMRGAAHKSAAQVFGSATLGYVEGARTIAVLGLYPAGAGVEVWLDGDPDRVRPHLLAIARHARLTLAALADSGHAPIFAHVRSLHEPGRRLARLVGLSRIEARESGGGAPTLERWEWRYGSARQGDLRRRER